MPVPIVIAGIIAGAVAVGNAIGKGVQNSKARKEARRVSELNRQRLLEDRKYNEPQQQMARFHDANLNPNLIYGSGQAGAGTATGGETTEQTQEFGPIDMEAGPLVSSVANIRRQKLQNDNIQSNTLKTDAETIGTIEKNRHDASHNPHLESLYGNIEQQVKTRTDEGMSKYQEWLDQGDTRRTIQDKGLEKIKAEIANIRSKTAVQAYEVAINKLKKQGVEITIEVAQTVKDYIIKNSK